MSRERREKKGLWVDVYEWLIATQSTEVQQIVLKRFMLKLHTIRTGRQVGHKTWYKETRAIVEALGYEETWDEKK